MSLQLTDLKKWPSGNEHYEQACLPFVAFF